MRELEKVLNEVGGAWLRKQLEQKEKWALAYDEGGFRYGIMTTNASESFNCVFRGVRSLPYLESLSTPLRSATNISSRGGNLRRGIWLSLADLEGPHKRK
jgi:hypothetical protein